MLLAEASEVGRGLPRYVERVLPHVPYRQGTLSFPHRVRWVLRRGRPAPPGEVKPRGPYLLSVPKNLSPKSPMPGTMKAFSFNCSSMEDVTIRTRG